MALSENQRISRVDDVLSRNLDGEAVLLNLGSGAYYALNEVGCRVWDLIVESKTLSEIRAALLTEYDVTSETLDRDLADLVHNLETRGLVRVDQE